MSTIDRTYDNSLIRDVGTGSTALGSIVPTLQAQANVPGNFKDPRNDRAQTLLFQGQLAKLAEQAISQDGTSAYVADNRSAAVRVISI